MKLGAHTNLNRARKGCVYVKVGIIVAVTEEVFVSSRQVNQASAETKGIQTQGSASVRGASAMEDGDLICPGLGSSSLHTSVLTYRLADQFCLKRQGRRHGEDGLIAGFSYV